MFCNGCIGTWPLAFLFVIWILRKLYGQRFFAYFISRLNAKNYPPLVALKKEFFQPLLSLQSEDIELRKKKGLRILEIGVGTGMNFAFFPEGTRLTVVDPNPHFKKYYDDKRSKFSNIHSEDIIVAKGEDMKMISSNSIDVVVMTQVMCSVEKEEDILKEIRRVLVPGGKYFFWEHIKEFKPEEHYIRAFLQKLLTYSGIFPFMFQGCHLTRDMSMALQSAGFSEISSKKVHTPQVSWFVIVSPHLVGTATK